MFIDTHAHLNDERLKPIAEEIIAGMERDGLDALINVGYDYASSLNSLELADKNAKVYAAVGIHPHDAKNAKEEHYAFFLNAAKNKKVAAIGEIGLDYYYDHSPRDVQAKVFLDQLVLSDNAGLPAVIHLRDAYQDMHNLIKDNRKYIRNGFVLHCYSGSAEVADMFNAFGAYYSFGGAVTYSKNKGEVLARIPKDRLMLETDCPYMAPVPYRGQTNLPKYIRYSAEKIADLINTNIESLGALTSANARKFFGRLI